MAIKSTYSTHARLLESERTSGGGSIGGGGRSRDQGGGIRIYDLKPPKTQGGSVIRVVPQVGTIQTVLDRYGLPVLAGTRQDRYLEIFLRDDIAVADATAQASMCGCP